MTHTAALSFSKHQIGSSVMIPRTLEPETMDSPAEAIDYDSMDHSEVNRIFVDDCLKAFESYHLTNESDSVQNPLNVLDVGTGTARIPIELCRRSFACQVTAIDLADDMLKVARRNVNQAGLERVIRLERVDAKQLLYDDGNFDAIISNSIVHHIPEPQHVVQQMIRVLRSGGVLFVRDLLRPNDLESVDRLVATYAGNENQHQQQMFRDSLCAALTLDEVRQILRACNVPSEWATQTTDRHWTLVGYLP